MISFRRCGIMQAWGSNPPPKGWEHPGGEFAKGSHVGKHRAEPWVGGPVLFYAFGGSVVPVMYLTHSST